MKGELVLCSKEDLGGRKHINGRYALSQQDVFSYVLINIVFFKFSTLRFVIGL